VDVRLRPRGGEGELVQTADAVFEYFQQTAAVWEAATYVKARPLAGDTQAAEEWCARLREILRQRFPSWETIRAGLAEMRQRLEEENAGSQENFKTGPGGLYDVDFILCAAALRAGAVPLAGRSWSELIETLGGEAGLSAGQRRQLSEGAGVLRAVDHAIRLAYGRSAPHLPSGARLEVVAELASGWLGESLSGATLVTRLAEARRRVREVFEDVLG
jgi:glutamate-ammonia-ligase adenylyltransferase